MRRLILCISAMMMLDVFPAFSQEDECMKYIMDYLGTDPEDSNDPYEVERLQDLAARPLRINLATRSKMISSGLFTNYQAASVLDYIRRHGDILSLSELSSVNGFGKGFTEKIAPFITFESSAAPGYSSVTDGSVSHDLSVRSGFKSTSERLWNYGLKYRLESSGLNAALSLSKSYDSSVGKPDAMSGYISWDFKRLDATFIAGDFNARFGQGLSLWNGMSISGFSSTSSFMRRSSGFSRSWSFTGNSSLTGLASSVMAGPVSVSAAVAFPGVVMPLMNLTWYMPQGQIGCTNYMALSGADSRAPGITDMKSSIDARFCFKGTDLFSEFVYDWVSNASAALAGTVLPVGENMRMSAMMRYYPPDFIPTMSAAPRSGSRCSNEYALSIAAESSFGRYVTVNGEKGFGSSIRKNELVFSADAAYFPESKSETIPVTGQIKLLMTWRTMLSDAFRLNLRLTERLRNWEDRICRTDFRTDLTFLSTSFTGTLRMNVMNCEDWGFLTYIEGGYRTDTLKLYLRQGLFLIDDWDDRIYAYERDAPGSFSVPAYYGRGLWTAFTATWRFCRAGRLYVRAAVTSYPFMVAEKKKPGKAELKLQCVFDF